MSSDNRSSIATPFPLATSGILQQANLAALTAVAVFFGWVVYYGLCLFPGLGGQVNAGDSAKFQILGHTPIMVHGPGYPLILMIGALIRSLALPLPPWWIMTFAISAVPGAIANAVAFLIARRLTGSILYGIAATLFVGSAGLMAVQATEAEVYAINICFVLTTLYLLVLFSQTKNVHLFIAACAVYAFSFGNHLMMIWLIPVFVWMTAAHHRIILRPWVIGTIVIFVLLGASQYLYLAYVAYDPNTSYSEYMPLPPTPIDLVKYVLGLYFSNLYGSGLRTSRTLVELINTIRSAHPWISLPVILAGAAVFAAGWQRRDAAWHGLAVVFGGALAFLPFTIWYGAFDIEAFHLPVLVPLLIGAVATLGWRLAGRRRLAATVAVVLIAIGGLRAAETAALLRDRAPPFAGLREAVWKTVTRSPVDKPVVAMAYGVRMAAMYYELLDELPRPATYRLHWRALGELRDQPTFGGIVMPSDGYQFVNWIKDRRPDMVCMTKKIELPQASRWPAYSFDCRSTDIARYNYTEPPAPERRTGVLRRE